MYRRERGTSSGPPVSPPVSQKQGLRAHVGSGLSVAPNPTYLFSFSKGSTLLAGDVTDVNEEIEKGRTREDWGEVGPDTGVVEGFVENGSLGTGGTG